MESKTSESIGYLRTVTAGAAIGDTYRVCYRNVYFADSGFKLTGRVPGPCLTDNGENPALDVMD